MKQTLGTAILILIVGYVTVGHTQSLGDVAKAEAARRAALTQPAKVYTNTDLVASAPIAAAQTPSSPAPATATVSTPPSKDTAREAAKEEAYWKWRMRVLQAQLAADITYGAAAQAQLDGLSNYVRPDRRMVPVVADNVFRARAELNQILAAIENDKRAIGDLEEEARRAKVPPGWLRP